MTARMRWFFSFSFLSSLERVLLNVCMRCAKRAFRPLIPHRVFFFGVTLSFLYLLRSLPLPCRRLVAARTICRFLIDLHVTIFAVFVLQRHFAMVMLCCFTGCCLKRRNHITVVIGVLFSFCMLLHRY
jgi:hypothetical protein